MERLLGRFAPQLYALMRIVVGLLFACHGAQKLFGLLGGQQMPLVSKFGLAGVIEFFGGLMIALGFLTSPAAFIASGEWHMHFTMHRPKGNVPIQNGGDSRCMLLRVPLHRGPGCGAWGIDKRRTSRLRLLIVDC
jgi:putative oxidoreductase